jgi:hypothetical protein
MLDIPQNNVTKTVKRDIAELLSSSESISASDPEIERQPPRTTSRSSNRLSRVEFAECFEIVDRHYRQLPRPVAIRHSRYISGRKRQIMKCPRRSGSSVARDMN